MAFYPDELSPIDRVRGLGKPTDVPDINIIKHRRQWKSIVLGKKDLGMNNFATIAEEKEEEISSDGSQGAKSNKGIGNGLNVSGVLTNKKITFPKPRKYITSRVADRKDDVNLRIIEKPTTPIGNLPKDVLGMDKKKSSQNIEDGLSAIIDSKSNILNAKHLLKAKKSRELITPKTEYLENYALNETPIETQWNEAVADAGFLIGWPKSSNDKSESAKNDVVQMSKVKQEDKKKSTGSSKTSSAETLKQESKILKKKGNLSLKKGKEPIKLAEETSLTNKTAKPSSEKGKKKVEKGKGLNMKDVVNVYKNLAYGSKDEIKSFVEKLSFVKDETENDKNLLSMMNLKALETKIKNFTKKNSKSQETATSAGKKLKAGKPIRKNRKAHIERLARHKVVKVPAVLNYNQLKNSVGENPTEKVSLKDKNSSMRDKEPWKYVGMQSILDKTYFVYPAYPPSINLKKAGKKIKAKNNKTDEEKREKSEATSSNLSSPFKPGPKVIRPNLLNNPKPSGGIRSGGTQSMNTLNVSSSMSNKSMNRFSATTVCTVEFRPAGPNAQKTLSVEDPESTDPSLLVYLHGTKAINIKSPYSDRQFSRVKFFRKDGRGMPLVKGLDRKALSKSYKNVSVRNINLPETLSRVRSLDLLDFDEDIQNISDFLRSQNNVSPVGQKEKEMLKRSEKVWTPKKPFSDKESRHQIRQRRSLQTHLNHHPNHHHHHQHGTSPESLSPDSIINEISKNIEHLQYLPDTEENRKMIAEFFDELDHRIEASKNRQLNFHKFPSISNSFKPIPILGY